MNDLALLNKGSFPTFKFSLATIADVSSSTFLYRTSDGKILVFKKVRIWAYFKQRGSTSLQLLFNPTKYYLKQFLEHYAAAPSVSPRHVHCVHELACFHWCELDQFLEEIRDQLQQRLELALVQTHHQGLQNLHHVSFCFLSCDISLATIAHL